MVAQLLPPVQYNDPSTGQFVYGLLYNNTPLNAVDDIMITILATSFLLFVDILLRFIIELIEFNKSQ